MKLVIYVFGIGRILCHWWYVGCGHIGSNQLYFDFIAFDSLPKPCKRVASPAVTHIYYPACVKVNDYCLIYMPLSYSKLIDTYLRYFWYVWMRVFLLEVLLVDVLYHIPSNAKMPCDIRYSAAEPQQVQYIVSKSVSITDITTGERYIRLMNLSTCLTLVSLDCHIKKRPLAADRKIVHHAVNNSITYNFCAATMRACHFFYRNAFEF